MAHPKRKTSKMKKRQRKAGLNKTVFSTVSEDKQNGGGFHLPHRVCPETGMYNGRQVLSISADD